MDNNQARYISLAMEGANYERSPSGDFHGEVPGFYGLKSRAKTREECEKQLRTSLEEWLADRRENELSIPTVGGFRIATGQLEIQEQRLDRLNRLEHEVRSLKIELLQDVERAAFIVGSIRRINTWYKSYWQLLVSLASIAIILVAYGAYDVDPIESYRETGEKKRLAAGYVQIGEQLLLRSGSRSEEAEEEAEKAYQSALDLYPSNMHARYGLLKAQILNPETGRNEYDIGMAKTKLATARGYIGENSEKDYYLYYVEGLIARDQFVASRGSDESKYTEAIRAFEKSKQLKAEFPGNYLAWGSFELYNNHPRAALAIFKSAHKNGGYSPSILIYLGLLNASYQEFDEAVVYLTEANTLATRLDTLIVLGDVYRHQSKRDPDLLSAATIWHEEAERMVSRENLKKGVDYDELLYTLMPAVLEEPAAWLAFSDVNDFKVLVSYTLSLDYILAESKEKADVALSKKKADAAFKVGFAQDICYGTEKKFKYWYLNQIDYLLIKPEELSSMAREWLLEKKKRIQSC